MSRERVGDSNILSVRMVLDEKRNEGVMTIRVEWLEEADDDACAYDLRDAYPYRAGRKIIRGRAVAGIALAVH